jgi:pimeloyl-ACP methyl ester carboxylesterase
MSQNMVVFLHGFASSGQGAKAQYLGQKFSALPGVDFHAFDFNPTPRDFEYMTITGSINRLRQYLCDHGLLSRDVGIIASSMGALVGLHYASRFGGVGNMLFLAPALSYLSRGGLSEAEFERWAQRGTIPVFHFAYQREIPLRYDLEVDGRRYAGPVPPAAPLTIVHGKNDEVIPSGRSRDYAARFPERVRLVEVDSDHRLNDRLDLIWEYAQSLFLKD